MHGPLQLLLVYYDTSDGFDGIVVLVLVAVLGFVWAMTRPTSVKRTEIEPLPELVQRVKDQLVAGELPRDELGKALGEYWVRAIKAAEGWPTRDGYAARALVNEHINRSRAPAQRFLRLASRMGYERADAEFVLRYLAGVAFDCAMDTGELESGPGNATLPPPVPPAESEV